MIGSERQVQNIGSVVSRPYDSCDQISVVVFPVFICYLIGLVIRVCRSLSYYSRYMSSVGRSTVLVCIYRALFPFDIIVLFKITWRVID